MTSRIVYIRNQAPTYTVPYLIRSGDNLTEISEATGIPIKTLVDINNIEDPDIIYTDDTLALPIYEYSIVNIGQVPVCEGIGGSISYKPHSIPDATRNQGTKSLISKYTEINNKGVSVWLQEKKQKQ